MRYFYLLLFVFCAAVSRAQISPNCTPSPALLYAYDNDVKDIAVQRMYELNSADTLAIEVPKPWQDTIFNALAAVCNEGPQLEADSVFRNYCVHRWPASPYTRRSIVVKVDTSYAWAKQWYLGSYAGTYPALDQFLAVHGVSVTSYFCISGSEYLNNRATLSAGRAINLKAFGDSLKKFPGVLYYEMGAIIGDGDHIFYTKDTAAHFTFIAGWGDCPAGCTSRKTWQYTVLPNTCVVHSDAITTGGFNEPHSLPNCDLRALAIAGPKRLTGIAIYPNPVAGEIHLSDPSLVAGYSICDATGRAVLSGTSRDGRIDVAQLSPGLYLLSLSDTATGERMVKKFLKQ